MPTAFDPHMSSRVIFPNSQLFLVLRIDPSGFVAHIDKREDSDDAGLVLHLQLVPKLPFVYDSELDAPHAFCRVNAYTSKALIQNDLTAIRVGRCASGLL